MAGQDAHRPQTAAAGLLDERCKPGRGRELGDDPLGFGEEMPGVSDLVIAERDDRATAAGDRRLGIGCVRGPGDPDRARDGHGSVRRLARDQPRQLAALLEAAGVGAGVPTAAVGKREHVGRRPQVLKDLERSGLLTLDAVRVERVDEHELVVPGELLCRVERLVEAAADLEQPGAGGDRLKQLRRGDAAGGDEHDRTQSGPRCVGSCGGSGVAGRRADDRPRSRLECPGDRDGHAPVLEASRRVRTLDLEPQVEPQPLREARCMDERRAALPERDERRAVANRQPVAEAHGESRHQIQPRSGTPRWEITGRTVGCP